jgi:hypothetical protein
LIGFRSRNPELMTSRDRRRGIPLIESRVLIATDLACFKKTCHTPGDTGVVDHARAAPVPTPWPDPKTAASPIAP